MTGSMLRRAEALHRVDVIACIAEHGVVGRPAASPIIAAGLSVTSLLRRRRRWRRQHHLRLPLSTPPVRHLQIVLCGRFGFACVQCTGGVGDVFEDEVEAAFGFAEGAGVVVLKRSRRAGCSILRWFCSKFNALLSATPLA
jgi:hypothetical protein